MAQKRSKRRRQPKFHYLATVARGLEALLRDELEEIGLTRLEAVPGGVTCVGTHKQAMKACLWSRLANRLLLKVEETEVKDEEEVYEWVRGMDLSPWLTREQTFSVRATVRGQGFKNSHFLALKVKDAIVDAERARSGLRPSVDTKNPDQRLVLHVLQGRAILYIAVDGAPLFQRGYRKATGEAPLKETLAAALVMLSGWDTTADLQDPFCGSGTLVIEAALMAANMPPGGKRSFAFERWPSFDESAANRWHGLKAEGMERQRVKANIFGSDREARALRAARKNATAAGVTDVVFFKEADARDIKPLREGGHIVANLPYGARLQGSESGLVRLHERFTERIRLYPGHVFTALSLPELFKQGVHMRPDLKLPVNNGKIECQIRRYPLGGAPKKRAASE